MFDLFQQLSDDQLAVLGCVLALLSGGLLLQLAYTFGPTSQRDSHASTLPINPLPNRYPQSDERAA